MPTVLIVEDNAVINRLYQIALTKAGYDTLFATSCRDALSSLETARPDVIMLDLALPDESGLSLVPHIKQSPDLVNSRLIVVSGNAGCEAEVKAAGVDYFLQKPVALPTLLELVGKLTHSSAFH